MTNIVDLSLTKDDSHTLYNREYNEHYHSQHGAIQESQYVFINKGLLSIQKESISIFEMGFGTGLNAYLTALSSSKTINYDAVETTPLPESVIKQLNYPTLLNDESDFFNDTSCFLESGKCIIKAVYIKKINSKIETLAFDKTYDLIYFDAFSPRIQPELWTEAVFRRLFEQMNLNAVLVTYCAKSAVRRILESIGFVVEKCPGPPGKREMLRAVKV